MLYNLKLTLSKKLYGNSLYSKRMEWTEKAIKSIPSGYKVLDAGAGQCKNKAFCDHLEYLSQDFCQYGEKSDSDTLEKLVGYFTPSDVEEGKWDTSKIDIVSDITDIPVCDNSFDAVICTEVFEHIIRPELAVKEFSRITRKGGLLIITAPACSGVHMAPFHFYYGISEFWYRGVLDEYGYDIVELKRNGNTFDKITELCCDMNSFVRFYNRKKGLNVFENLIIHLAALITHKYAKKTEGSEYYYTNEIMILARKK